MDQTLDGQMKDHLKTLKTLDYIFAGLCGLGLIIVLASAGVALAALWGVDDRAAEMMVSLILWINGGAVLATLVLMVLALVAGRRMAQGKGRGVQTAVALLSLPSIPLGTAFGTYALWVCWINPETVETLTGGQGSASGVGKLKGLVGGAVAVTVLMGFAITGLILYGTVMMMLPIDPERVANLHPPIEDRAGRTLSPEQCGLNQTRQGTACEDISAAFEEKEVQFPSRLTDKGISELRGTLALPKGVSGPVPGLVIVHGSGPSTRDGAAPGDLVSTYAQPFPLYKALSEFFVSQGIAVLRYDKRSSPPHHGQFDMETFAFSDFVDDARDGLDFLAQHPAIDPDALIVLGHSQGGQLAPHIAHKDSRVAAVILVGGSTQTFGKLVVEQIERVGEVRRRQGDYASAWFIPMSVEPWRACFEPVWSGDFEPDATCQGIPYRTWADYEALGETTGAVLTDLDAPVFAIQGTADINIDPMEIPRMQALLKGRDAEFHTVYGLDHSLVNHFDRPSPVALDAEAKRRLQAFLRSVPRTPARK